MQIASKKKALPPFLLTQYRLFGYKNASRLLVAWPSGKAEACKASIPSSNLGATFLSLFFANNVMLYLVATPIGNLADITFRAIDILKTCDYILCEDTRHSLILLNHYNIKKLLKSYHKFNEAETENKIIQDLQLGKQIALISDAGTPGMADPGQRLVEACRQKNIAVTPIPGPCAAIAALTSSGMPTDLFQFFGFLPRKQGDLRSILQKALFYPGTTVCYESPQRLLQTLQLIHELDEKRILAVARELTKKFEELSRGTALNLIDKWKIEPLKGEIVLLISGLANGSQEQWQQMTPAEHVAHLELAYGMTNREAIKLAAEQRGASKRTIYNMLKINE
jgi:16S rRNA (cytidine1402-2'-O)-methyltransferase